MSVQQEEEVAAFCAEHGLPLLAVKGGGDLKFLADGAHVLPGWCGTGPILIPPPEDSLKLLEARRLYWRERVKRIVDVFKNVRRNYLGMSFDAVKWDEESWGTPPDCRDEINSLEHIAEVVKIEKSKLREIEDEYESHPEIVAAHEWQAQHDRRKQERQEEARELRERIERMTV